MNRQTPASRALTAAAIPHAEFRHAGNVTTLEQAAAERGQRPEQVVRSLVFRLGESKFVMVLAAGGQQVSWKKLREHLGQRRLSLATADEVFKVTGYRIGSVAPVGLTEPIPVLIDRSILRESALSVGSGVPGIGILISRDDLLRALGSTTIVDLV